MNFETLLKHASKFEKVAQETLVEPADPKMYTLTTDFLNSSEVDDTNGSLEKVVQIEKELPVLANSSYFVHIGDAEGESEYLEETVENGSMPYFLDILVEGEAGWDIELMNYPSSRDPLQPAEQEVAVANIDNLKVVGIDGVQLNEQDSKALTSLVIPNLTSEEKEKIDKSVVGGMDDHDYYSNY